MSDILNIGILLLLLPVMMAAISVAPWVPMKKKDLKRVNSLAALQDGDVFYEIGSGDGRVCHYIAKNNPKVHVIGIEMAFPIYILSKIRNAFNPQDNLKLYHANAFKFDISNADVVYTFAMQKSINEKLKNKFLKELKKGAKIVSYVFSMKQWEGDKYTDFQPKSLPIHVYTV